jgi:pimeloyl-ACP methyl ester carboxylesterase
VIESTNIKGFTQKDLFYPASDVTYEFLDLNGEQIYFICHEPADNITQATVIIARPFGHERTSAYLTLTRWARFLAMSGLRAVAFDYRGCGESSGAFDDFTFEDWEEDLEYVFHICRERFPRNAFFLSGLRFGAILASRVFSRALGDGLLLWNGPDSVRSILNEILRMKLSIEALAGIPNIKLSRQSYIAELESDRRIYVGGQFWTKRLWKNSSLCTLVRPDENEARPWIEIRLNPQLISPKENNLHFRNIQIPTPPFWGGASSILNPDVHNLFIQSRDWILSVINKSNIT